MPAHDYDVCILGAGAAGLAAARILAGQGRRVLIVEARDRIGGRAWSIDAPLAPIPIETGPEFIHGHPESTLRLLRRYGISYYDCGEQSWSFDRGDGKLEDDASAPALQALMQRAAQRLGAHDAGLADAIGAVVRPDEAELQAELFANARGFDAADPQDASFLALYEEWRGDASLATAAARIDGGYRRLWYALASEITGDGGVFMLQTPVREIAYDEFGVRIRALQHGLTTRTISAERCLVTLPIGVLQKTIADGSGLFSPELPVERRHALAQIGMGEVVKVHGLFTTPFWESMHDGKYADAAFIRASEQSAFRTFWTTSPYRSAILTAWAGGSDVNGALTQGRSAIERAFFESIRQTFGDDAGSAAEAACTWVGVWDWQADAFACGAYSYARVGGMQARKLLRSPLCGRVFFAGEAYAEHGEAGTVAGAIETGEAAAAEILGPL